MLIVALTIVALAFAIAGVLLVRKSKVDGDGGAWAAGLAALCVIAAFLSVVGAIAAYAF